MIKKNEVCMLEMMDIGVKGAIAYRVGEKVTDQEMKAVLSVFKEKIDQGEKLVIYQEVTGFSGVEIDALVEKFKFFKDVGWSHFSRIVVVTPKKWLSRLVDLESKLFPGIEMKGFSMEEKDLAIEYLKQ
jgi:hypothetical protein